MNRQDSADKVTPAQKKLCPNNQMQKVPTAYHKIKLWRIPFYMVINPLKNKLKN